MGTQTQALIDNSIKKYAGGDAGYAQTLKEHVRNAMGYSNYMDKLGQDSSQVADIGDVNGLSYNGIKERMNSRFGIQNANIATDQKNMGAIDSAAGTIADSQISAAKSAASNAQNNTGFQNGVTFQPQSQLDQHILAYMQNPKNPDGSVKSLQQFQSEMNQKFQGNDQGVDHAATNPDGTPMTKTDGSGVLQETYNPDQVNSAIAQRVPKDFIGNEDKYSLMSQGYSEKQAKTLQGALRYDTMSAPEKLIYETTNPAMAKSLQDGTMDKGLVQDLSATVTTPSGQVKPANSFTDLQNKYPNVPAATLKGLAAPIYQKSATADASALLAQTNDNGDTILNAFKNVYTNGNDKDKTKGFEGIKATAGYKDLFTKINLRYGDILSSADIERMILTPIAQQLSTQ